MVASELRREGVRSNRGSVIHKGVLYRLLSNQVYIGEAVHKGAAYPGEHAAIIDRDLWDRVHAIVQQSPRKRASNTRAQTPALLKGLLFGRAARRSHRRTPGSATGSTGTTSARPF